MMRSIAPGAVVRGVGSNPPEMEAAGADEPWLGSEVSDVTSAVAAMVPAAGHGAPSAGGDGGEGGGEEPAAPLRLRLRGQVCRKRLLSKNLIFVTLRQAESCAAWDSEAPRLQSIAKLQSLGAEGMGTIKQLVKLGDMLQVEGLAQQGSLGPELLLERCAVAERWAVACRGVGFKPDIEPPSQGKSPGVHGADDPGSGWAAAGGAALQVTGGEAGQDSAPLCKFWVNTGVCRRSGCRFRHSDADDRPWSEIRTEWQRERSAKRHAARQSARMAGEGDEAAHGARSAKPARAAVFAGWLLETFGAETLNAGSGVVDVAGGRGELSFELAARRGVETTLLDPRHPGKLSKQQKKFVRAAQQAEAEGGRGVVLPQRVRAMLTLEGATRVQPGASKPPAPSGDSADGADAAKAAAAEMSMPPSVAGASAQRRGLRPDALSAAAFGWRDLPPEASLESLLSGCSALIGLHPDQATEPLVRCALRNRRHWSATPTPLSFCLACLLPPERGPCGRRAIVPCCVFAADFPNRSLPATLQHPPEGGAAGPGRRGVHSYEDLVEYLTQLGNAAARTEAEKVQQGFLPFVGKNLVLWQRFEAAVAVAPSAGSGSCSVGSSAGEPLREAEPAAPTDAPS